MSKRLTIISYLQRMEPFIEGVALKVKEQAGHNVRRCQELKDLYGTIEEAGGGGTLCLDLVGHGKPTRFRLGDELLLQSGQEPPEVFKRLDHLLPREARVRLLGCYTGAQDEGWAMLQAASRALGGRVVLGTTVPIHSSDFDENGLTGDFERDHLLASDARSSVQPQPLLRWKALDGEREEVSREPREAARWKTLLPAEYQVMGRNQPLTERDASLSYEGVTITFASDRLLVLIEDDRKRPPLVLQWSSPAPPPGLGQLMKAFQG